METNWGDACLVITDQACNPLGPFCFANDNEDRLSTVEHQTNGLLQQPQSIGPGRLHQNPRRSLASQRLEQWLRPRHVWVRNERCGDAEIALVRLSKWSDERRRRGRRQVLDLHHPSARLEIVQQVARTRTAGRPANS